MKKKKEEEEEKEENKKSIWRPTLPQEVWVNIICVNCPPCQISDFLIEIMWIWLDPPPFGKNVKIIMFLKPLFGALPRIDDWIQKYVQIHHGF